MNSYIYAGSSWKNSSSSTLTWSKYSPESGPDLLLRWQNWDRARHAPSDALKSLGHTRLSKLTITSISAWNTVGSDLLGFHLLCLCERLTCLSPSEELEGGECRSCAMRARWKWSRLQYLPPGTQKAPTAFYHATVWRSVINNKSSSTKHWQVKDSWLSLKSW